ncbi:hypothetical protein TNCV_3921971 [Trichonephila clavipes]|nr:hypothetical protein TNCV_3921971 [Trichonephila clavipes]
MTGHLRSALIGISQRFLNDTYSTKEPLPVQKRNCPVVHPPRLDHNVPILATTRSGRKVRFTPEVSMKSHKLCESNDFSHHMKNSKTSVSSILRRGYCGVSLGTHLNFP